MGIEPTRPAWKAGILPLNYTRVLTVTGNIIAKSGRVVKPFGDNFLVFRRAAEEAYAAVGECGPRRPALRGKESGQCLSGGRFFSPSYHVRSLTADIHKNHAGFLLLSPTKNT